MTNKKGSLQVGLVLVVSLFLVSLVFLIFVSPTMQLLDFANNQSAVSGSVDASNTVDRIERTWNIWPIVVLIVIIVWAIMTAMRREPLSGY